jgi:hypothetical protein
MADHPFHGTWTSYVIRDKKHFDDGTIELDIDAQGNLRSGKHTPIGDDQKPGPPIDLESVRITTQEIHIKEKAAPFRIYHGFLVRNPFMPSQKVTAGGFRDPGRREFTQVNGTWVATQP